MLQEVYNSKEEVEKESKPDVEAFLDKDSNLYLKGTGDKNDDQHSDADEGEDTSIPLRFSEAVRRDPNRWDFHVSTGREKHG